MFILFLHTWATHSSYKHLLRGFSVSDPGTYTWKDIFEIKMPFVLIQCLLILGGKIKQFKFYLSGLIFVSTFYFCDISLVGSYLPC